jgi:hypothetical protein
MAFRIVLGLAFAIEVVGYAFALSTIVPIGIDAAHAPQLRAGAGAAALAATSFALHGAYALTVVSAIVLVRRHPLGGGLVAAFAGGVSARVFLAGDYGFSFAKSDVYLTEGTLFAIASGVLAHAFCATLACAIAIASVPLALAARRRTEPRPPASNPAAS